MKRVLHVVSSMNRGGIETLLMTIYRNIDREKLQFDFLVSTNKESEYDEEILKLGGNIYRIPSRRESFLRRNEAIKKFFEQHQYDVVHQHVSSLTDVKVLEYAKKYGVTNRIIHSHNTKGPRGLLHFMSHKINKQRIGELSTYRFSCSIEAGKWCFKKKHMDSNFEVFNNAIDTKKFIYNENTRLIIRDRLRINDEYLIGHVGRFSNQKNHIFILDVFSEIIKRKPNSKLLLIGVGPLEEKIKTKAKENNILENIIFLKSVSNVNEYMQAMDLFLFPSLYEGLGIVAIEAQAASLPVLASSVVPKEAAISNLFYSMNLDRSAQEWGIKVLDLIINNERKNMHTVILKNNYDIGRNSKYLTNFYLSKMEDN